MEANAVEDLINKINNFDDPTIPQWAKILIQSMHLVLHEFKVVKSLASKIKVLEDCKSVHENVTTRLQEDNLQLHNKIKSLEERIDDGEQRSRNQCLLIHGIAENDEEDTDTVAVGIINNELEILEFTASGLHNSHRLGPKKNRRNTRNTEVKPRPIIIRFVYYRDRYDVFKNKSKLKGKNMYITENLTKSRVLLYQAAKEAYGKQNVWTSGGRVVTKVNGNLRTITRMEDII